MVTIYQVCEKESCTDCTYFLNYTATCPAMPFFRIAPGASDQGAHGEKNRVVTDETLAIYFFLSTSNSSA